MGLLCALQVTAKGVRLIDCHTKQLVSEWHPSSGRSINVAAGSPTQVSGQSIKVAAGSFT